MLPEKIVLAAHLRSIGWSWGSVSLAVCVDERTIRKALKHGFIPPRKQRVITRTMHHGILLERQCAKPTPQMLAERDRAFSRPITPTAFVCGDPAPGRSALDRRSA